METVMQVVERVKSDADDGVLADMCESLGVDLLVLFGSAAEHPETAGDVDVA